MNLNDKEIVWICFDSECSNVLQMRQLLIDYVHPIIRL